MVKVYDSILDLVGKTPLVELKRIEEKEGLQAKLIAKVESFNPAGSVKDRIAKAMIEDAEAKGLLKEGSVIIDTIRRSGKAGYGFDAYKEEYCDMIAGGIVDPAKVTRSALENAASVSGMVLTTESLVAEKPAPQPAPQPGDMAGGMGGMY